MTSQTQIMQPFKTRYALLKLLGHGGMGEVYVARDDELRRDVAIKLIHEETSAIPEMRLCFNREARAISLLHHPNVVDIYDFGTTDSGQIYLSTELVRGDSLHGVNRCALPLCCTLDLMIQLLDALELAHNRGLIHRDLKAENVLLTFQDGKLWVKLADFGLASLPSLLDSAASLRDETSFGTPGYMAPEQILHGMNYVGPCTDIYAAGVLLFESLSGKMPYERATAMETMRAHLQAPIPEISWRDHLADTPEAAKRALNGILRIALDKAPWMRYLTAKDFAAALAEVRSAIADNPLPDDAIIAQIRAASSSSPQSLTTQMLEKRDICAKIRAFEAAEDSGLSAPPQKAPGADSGERSGLSKAPEGGEPQTNSGLLNSSFLRAKALLFDSIMASVAASLGADFEFYREILLRTSALGCEFCLNLAEAFWRNDEDRALADCWREALAAWAQNKILQFNKNDEGVSQSPSYSRAGRPKKACKVTVSFADSAFADVCHAALGTRKLRALKAQAAMAMTEICIEPSAEDLHKIACFWKDANQTAKYIRVCAASAQTARRNPREIDLSFAALRFEELGAVYDAMISSGAKAQKHPHIHAIDWPEFWVSAAQVALLLDSQQLFEKSCERIKVWVNLFSKPVYLAHLQRLSAIRHLRRENWLRASEIASLSCESFSICNEEIECARSQIVKADAEIALGNVRPARQVLSAAYETFHRFGMKPDMAQVQLRLGCLDWCGGQPLLARDNLRAALPAFQKAGDREWTCRTELHLNFIQYLEEPTKENLKKLRETAKQVSSFGDRVLASQAHVREAAAIALDGDWASFDALESEQRAAAGKNGLLPEMNGAFSCIHAVRHAIEGRAETAQSEITTAIAYFGPHRRRARAFCHTLLGVVSIFMHQIRSGLPSFERARNDFTALNDVFGLACVWAAQSALAAVCGEFDDAFSMAMDGMELSVNGNFRIQASMLSAVAAVAATAGNRIGRIEQALPNGDVCMPNIVLPYYKKWLENSLDRLSEMGDAEALRKAVDIRRRFGFLR